MSIDNFFTENRKLIDARKAHLARVGVRAPEQAPLRDAMPSQADALTMPTTADTPLIEASHPARLPRRVHAAYETPKLPKLPGVDGTSAEE